VHHYNSTQYCKTETVFSILPFLQTNITSQMWPSRGKGAGIEHDILTSSSSSRMRVIYHNWVFYLNLPHWVCFILKFAPITNATCSCYRMMIRHSILAISTQSAHCVVVMATCWLGSHAYWLNSANPTIFYMFWLSAVDFGRICTTIILEPPLTSTWPRLVWRKRNRMVSVPQYHVLV